MIDGTSFGEWDSPSYFHSSAPTSAIKEIEDDTVSQIQKRLLQRTGEEIVDVIVPQTLEEIVEVIIVCPRVSRLRSTSEQIEDVPGPHVMEDIMDVVDLFPQQRIQMSART